MRAWTRLPLSLLLLLLVSLGLAACGGGGGGAGTPGGPTLPPPGATAGSLAVSASGLPAGVNAAVRVSGPSGYQQDLTASQTLSGLAPGSYTVTAAPVTAGGVTYTPSPATQTAVVSAGGSVSAAIAYGGAAPVGLVLSQVASGFDNPTFLTAQAGDTRLFVVERPGRIRIVENGAALALPFLDISSRVFTGGEGGLLSMAFDPNYASNGYVYLYYTDPQQNIVIERFGRGSNANLADPTSSLVILRIPHPTFTNHFGGQVAFGPDGNLYLGTGDGGGAGDPGGNGQNLNSLLGKLLRIDVRASTAAQPYAIPAGNPYLNQPDRRPEIWAAGLRNPWRFSFDGGQLYLSDVGQERREEVNIVGAGAAGLNYGWNTMEGTLCFNAATCSQAGLTLPVFEYDHGTADANGCSITGGYVYRGSAIPSLQGRYFYSDYCRGFLKSFLAGSGAVSEQRDWNPGSVGNVVSFGQDGQGELYLMTARGFVYKIVRSSTP